MEQTLYQYFFVGHSKNGNRIAFYLEYFMDGTVRAYYQYDNGLPEQLRNSIPLPEVNVKRSEMIEWKNRAMNPRSNINYYG